VDAGYSQTPQLKKLGLLPGVRWAVDGRPAGWHFDTEPDAADEVAPGEPADVVVAFARVALELPPLLGRLEQQIFPAGALWVAWPRRAGGHHSDITDNVVRDAAIARALVDTKVAAVDADWSSLKLVWRVSARGRGD
jgi:hypothetical protein